MVAKPGKAQKARSGGDDDLEARVMLSNHG
jgi:hypothetical protein